MMILFRFLLFWALPLVAAFAGIFLAVKTRRYADVWSWYWRSTALYLIGLLFTVLGVVMVAVGLPFRINYPVTTIPFSDPRFTHRGNWFLSRLPRWCLPWDNAFDGAIGDKRGWYANWCIEKGLGYPSFLAMWNWLAIRNPANYWSRNITGCNVVGSVVEIVFGPAVVDEDHPGFHFLILTDARGKRYPVVEICWPWPFARSHAIYGRFGWKIKADHASTPAAAPPQDQIKGSVYRCSLWKAVG